MPYESGMRREELAQGTMPAQVNMAEYDNNSRPRGGHFASSSEGASSADHGTSSLPPKRTAHGGARRTVPTGDSDFTAPVPQQRTRSAHRSTMEEAERAHHSSDHEGMRRVKKRRHKGLKRAGIVLGVIAGILVCCGVALALWVNSLGASMSFDDAEEEQALREALLPQSELTSDDAFYLLILGSDARSGDTASRSDVTMLCRIDPSNAQVDLISIPRDTMVTLNGTTEKINAAYAFGGAAGAVNCVSEFAGVPISHYAEVHFSELESVVDQLGGVWVDVPQSFAAGNGGMSFEAGNQLLNGEQALAYARERYNVAGGDFGRAQAQRQIVEAIIRQVIAAPATELPSLIGKLASSITTDYSITDLVGLAQKFIGKNVTIYSAACPSYSYSTGGVSYVCTMFNEWRSMMQRVDAGLDPNDTSATIPEAQLNNADLGAAPNSPAPRDYQALAASAGLTTDDVATVQ